MEQCHRQPLALNKAVLAVRGVIEAGKPREHQKPPQLSGSVARVGQQPAPARRLSSAPGTLARDPALPAGTGSCLVYTAAGSLANCVQGARGAASQPAAVKTSAGPPGSPAQNGAGMAPTGSPPQMARFRAGSVSLQNGKLGRCDITGGRSLTFWSCLIPGGRESSEADSLGAVPQMQHGESEGTE